MPESALPSAADLLAMIPYAATLGITLDEATPQRTRGRLHWSPGLCTTGGVMNGGAIISLADNIGALCAFLNLPAGAGTATVDSATNFFRGVREGTLHATGPAAARGPLVHRGADRPDRRPGPARSGRPRRPRRSSPRGPPADRARASRARAGRAARPGLDTRPARTYP